MSLKRPQCYTFKTRWHRTRKPDLSSPLNQCIVVLAFLDPEDKLDLPDLRVLKAFPDLVVKLENPDSPEVQDPVDYQAHRDHPDKTETKARWERMDHQVPPETQATLDDQEYQDYQDQKDTVECPGIPVVEESRAGVETRETPDQLEPQVR